MFLLPSRSLSPNAYCAPLVENKMRASVNVIHPRSSGGNADKERASVVSLVPSSFVASGGAAASAPNSIAIKLLIPILEDSCGLHQRIFNGTAIPALHLIWRLLRCRHTVDRLQRAAWAASASQYGPGPSVAQLNVQPYSRS